MARATGHKLKYYVLEVDLSNDILEKLNSEKLYFLSIVVKY